jgi:carboxyl-terminal processing protease
VTPPELEVNVPSYEVVGGKFRLRSKVTDDTKVSDFFVYVSNRDAKVENKKVFYRSNRKGKNRRQMLVDTAIPLWPGTNIITVVARENSEVQATHTLYLYRSDGKDRTVARESK